MRKEVVISFAAILACTAIVQADYLIGADSAPNVYGDPDFATWRTAAFQEAANGSFLNMKNGAHPGTTTFAPTDAIVDSTGYLGNRLHWIYWLPGETLASLNGRFQVKDVYDWNGVDYTYDWSLGDSVVDGPDEGWSQPGKWMEFTNSSGVTGVIGTFGDAMWAGDNDALPYDTDMNPWNETDAADIAATGASMLHYQTHWTGLIRYRADASSPWQTESLKLTLVPAPGAVLLGLMGFSLIGWVKRRFA